MKQTPPFVYILSTSLEEKSREVFIQNAIAISINGFKAEVR